MKRKPIRNQDQSNFQAQMKARNKVCGFDEKNGIIGNYYITVARLPLEKTLPTYTKLVRMEKARVLIDGRYDGINPVNKQPQFIKLKRDFIVARSA